MSIPWKWRQWKLPVPRTAIIRFSFPFEDKAVLIALTITENDVVNWLHHIFCTVIHQLESSLIIGFSKLVLIWKSVPLIKHKVTSWGNEWMGWSCAKWKSALFTYEKPVHLFAQRSMCWEDICLAVQIVWHTQTCSSPFWNDWSNNWQSLIGSRATCLDRS